jgi:hypothetical protein
MKNCKKLSEVPAVTFDAGKRLSDHGYTWDVEDIVYFGIYDIKSNTRVYLTNSLVDACIYLGIAY